MILISENQDPKHSVLYISGCIFDILTKEQNQLTLKDLFKETKKQYNRDLHFNRFLLSLDFLFLCNLIEAKTNGVALINVK